MKTKLNVLFVVLIIFGIPTLVFFIIFNFTPKIYDFNSGRALQDVGYQVSLGPRTIGSEAHDQLVERLSKELKKERWSVELQETVISQTKITNVIAKRGSGSPWVIVGTHYDSRLYADKDPMYENRTQPVPGANDGASTVAILLELARVLPARMDKQVWFVFFDAEDNGNIPGYDWSLGSQYFVSKLNGKPDSVVVLDMLGDKDLNIYMEKNSDPNLNKEIWSIADSLGYSQFIASYKFPILDDHLPFIRAGIKAIDIIDFDYPYWHTSQDTVDKISAESLEVVGNTIMKWLGYNPRIK